MIDAITIKRAAEVGLPAAEANPDPPLMAFPLKSEWVALQPAETVSWPDPEVAAVEIQPGTGKPAVEDMCRLAGAFGWSIRVTEARGCWPSVGQKPSVQRWSQVVRMWRGPERAVAVYVEDAGGKTWKWVAFYWWHIGEFPNCTPSVNGFLDMLFGPLCKPAWPGAYDWRCPYFGPVHGPEKPKRVR